MERWTNPEAYELKWWLLLVVALLVAPLLAAIGRRWDRAWHRASPEGMAEEALRATIERALRSIADARTAAEAEWRRTKATAAIPAEAGAFQEARDERVDAIFTGAIARAEYLGEHRRVERLLREWAFYRRDNAEAEAEIQRIGAAYRVRVYGVRGRGITDAF